MSTRQLDKATIDNLNKLVGGQIYSIFVKGGRLEKGKNLILYGHGMISIVVRRNETNYKWRMMFYDENIDKIYSKFYEWKSSPLFKERYNARTGEVNYDKDLDENVKVFPTRLVIVPEREEDIVAEGTIKTMKFYNHVGEYDNGYNHNYLAIIDIETEMGRRIIIEIDETINSYNMYFDDLKILNRRLAEIHDDKGRTYGEKRYQLYLEIT